MTNAITDLVSHLRRVKDAPAALIAIKKVLDEHEETLRAIIRCPGVIDPMRWAAVSAIHCRSYIVEFLKDDSTPPRAA